MQRTIVAPAELPDAALAELKQWLAIRSSTDDAALGAQLRTALEVCEAFTGAMPLMALCEEVLAASGEWQALDTRPVQSLSGIEAIPSQGARCPLAPEAYELDIAADGRGLVRMVSPGNAGRVAIRFTAGLAPAWEQLPEGLRHGVVRLAAHHWRERDSGVDAAPPAAVVALWRPWRRVRL